MNNDDYMDVNISKDVSLYPDENKDKKEYKDFDSEKAIDRLLEPMVVKPRRLTFIAKLIERSNGKDDKASEGKQY